MSEVDEESKQTSYKVVIDENRNVQLDCPAIGKQFAAEEITAQVLRKLVDDSSKFLNDKVTKVVVSVPAYFNDSQKDCNKRFLFVGGHDGVLKCFPLLEIHIWAVIALKMLKRQVENSLRDAKLSFKDLHKVILFCGSTRIPAVEEFVRKMTGKEPNATFFLKKKGNLRSVNPNEVVALGTAVQAGVLARVVSDIVLFDITPLSRGLEILGGIMTKIIPRNYVANHLKIRGVLNNCKWADKYGN